MKQPVFNYPDLFTRIKILRLINQETRWSHASQIEDAYRILAKFYGVPAPKVSVSPDEFYKIHREDFLKVLASYSPGTQRVIFKSKIIAENQQTVLHEFYHHLEHSYEINGDGKGPKQTADSWADWFIRETAEYDALCYPFHDEYVKRDLTLYYLVKSGAPTQTIRDYRRHTWSSREYLRWFRKEERYILTEKAENLLRMGTKLFHLRFPKNMIIEIRKVEE